MSINVHVPFAASSRYISRLDLSYAPFQYERSPPSIGLRGPSEIPSWSMTEYDRGETNVNMDLGQPSQDRRGSIHTVYRLCHDSAVNAWMDDVGVDCSLDKYSVPLTRGLSLCRGFQFSPRRLAACSSLATAMDIPQQCLAGVVVNEGPDFHLEVVQVPVPEPGPGQVLIRLNATGLCMSDVHYMMHDIGAPPMSTFGVRSCGHEGAGVIVRLGPGVTTLKVGQRVGYKPTWDVCHSCDSCRRGREQYCKKAVATGLFKPGGSCRPERGMCV